MSELLYEQHGYNYLRFLAILGLVLISIISFILTRYIGFIVAIFGFYCLSMILFIKFPKLKIFDDRVEFVRRNLIRVKTDKKEIKYIDIKSIEYFKSENSYKFGLFPAITIFGYFFLLNSSKDKYVQDYIQITKINNEKLNIIRFGSKKGFKTVTKIIQSKIK
jgi:hypothetical protein